MLGHALPLESRSVGQHFKDKFKNQVAALRGKNKELKPKTMVLNSALEKPMQALHFKYAVFGKIYTYQFI